MRRLAASLVATLAASALGAQAPGGRCDIEVLSGTDSSRFNILRDPIGGAQRVFFGAGFRARCLNQDVRLAADSAEWYQQSQVLILIGRVRYTEPRVVVTSDRASYFQGEERLLAEGNVDAVLPSGSTMRGPEATYLRAVRGLRPVSSLSAPSRPRFTLAQRDSSGRPAEPVTIVADRVVTQNDSLVYAGGRVDITRTDFDARSDSAFMDSGREYVQLLGSPVARGKGDAGYTLRGRILDVYSRERVVQRVLARAEARATSDDLLLTSDTIDLRLADNRLQQAFVWGKSRARAVSPDRDLVADSIWVRMPDQRLRELRAFGDAVANTIPDTARIRSGEKDWLRGDTILAWFDSTNAGRADGAKAATPAPPRDRAARDRAERARRDSVAGARARPGRDDATIVAQGDTTPAGRAVAPGAPPARDTSAVRLVALEARGRASARTQVASANTPAERPGINYSRGRTIRVRMDSTSEVRAVEVEGDAVGVYLEPAERPSTGPAPAGGVPATPATPGSAPVPPTRAPTPARPTPPRP
jgi:lipopolysaccharide export system protein LptA